MIVRLPVYDTFVKALEKFMAHNAIIAQRLGQAFLAFLVLEWAKHLLRTHTDYHILAAWIWVFYIPVLAFYWSHLIKLAAGRVARDHILRPSKMHKIFALHIAIMAVMFVIPLIGIQYIPAITDNPSTHRAIFTFISLLTLYFAHRFLFVFPGLSLGDKSNLLVSWYQTGPVHFKMVFLTLASVVPIMFIGEFLNYMVNEFAGTSWRNWLGWMADIFTFLLASSFLCFIVTETYLRVKKSVANENKKTKPKKPKKRA